MMDEESDNKIDPFVIDAVVTKAYDRRIFIHSEFEKVCSQYWQLLHSQPMSNRTSDVITKHQYTELLKRVYKVLLPLYREEEMNREVAQEWIHDARGQSTMNLTMFQKMLFRIAHSWAIHIDMDEYVELLQKIYDRITVKKVIRGDTGAVEIALPRIQVELLQEKEEEDGAEWQSCLSDEYQDEDFEYMHREDPADPSVTKRYKRPLPQGTNEDDGGVMMTVRDPFLFKEEVQYFREPAEGDFDSVVRQPSERDVVVDLIADMGDVYPLGYPTEQFIGKLKNDIIAAFIKLKEDRRKAVAEMRRQMFEDGAKMKVERPPEIQRDPGILDAQGFQFEEFFTMMDTRNEVKIPTLLRVQDRIYNQMRQLFKESSEMVIRPHFNHPSKAVLKGNAPSKTAGDQNPFTQVNEHGFNPALERRLQYKQIVCEMGEGAKSHCVNVNYLVDDPVFATAFRSDVNRVETTGKMSIQPNKDGDVQQAHEFCNVTTPFQKTMQIMLAHKFQTFWGVKVSDKQSPVDKQRDEKTYQYEEDRKRNARGKDSLTTKNLTENFDEKNYLKVMRGPFYNMISREGSREDDFVDCTTRDLIDSANAELMKVLLLGKPRSGKTTLAKALCAKLDLVRISPDIWIEELFVRIKDREENPPEEEEAEEPEEVKEEAEPEEAKGADGGLAPAQEDPGEQLYNDEGQRVDEHGNVIEDPEPAPKEPELPKRAKEDEWLTELEYQVRNMMRDGSALSDDLVDDVIKEMVESNEAQTKGFIIDLTFADGIQWGSRLIERETLAGANELTHIIELTCDDDEVRRRAAGLLQHPKDPTVYSKWERAERNRPKPVVLDEDGNPVEEEEEQPEDYEELLAKGLVGPLVDQELVARSCDEAQTFNREVDFYNSERNIFETEFMYKLFDSTFIKVDVAGLTPDELTESVLIRMKPNEAEPLRPIATIIEDGAGSFKELLTAGQGDDDDADAFFLPRQWSLWKTTDPVCLAEGQVEEGVPEFAAHFGNNVFVFKDEANLKKFVQRPRFYIDRAPEMPPNFRLLMMGPRGIGLRTQAEKLQQLYGWRVVDFKAIVQDKLKEIIARPLKLPNNIPALNEGPCEICLSQQELSDIKAGQPFPSWKFLPWVMEYLGVPLGVTEAPGPEPIGEEDEEMQADPERLKAHREKKKKREKEEAAAAKAKAEAAAAKAARLAARKQAAIDEGRDPDAELESEDEKVIEDCEIDRLCLANKDQVVDRFIFIGFPQTATHCEKLGNYNIDFDRILFLSEEDEEEKAGEQVTKRMTEKDETAYDWPAELEIANALAAVVKEWLGEEKQDKVMEMKDCTGTADEVHFKIRSRLDPFFTRPDDTTDNIRTSADYEEEEIHRMPRSDFGDYCPVTYVDHGFLVKGGADEEGGDPNELYVRGKRYFFAGEEEMKKFKNEPSRYMIVQNHGASLPLAPPPPKFLITGNKCAGISTQINLLCEKFKLDQLELQATFSKKQAEQLDARRRKRLLERGFKGIPEPEEGEEKEPDTEILEDPEDFDKAAQDIADLRAVIDAKKGLIIDGNWRAQGEEPDYALPDLLKNARRMPEVVIVLRCKEEVSIKRDFADNEEEMKATYERLCEERKEQKAKDKEAAKEQKEQELAAEEPEEGATPEQIAEKKEADMKAWEEEYDDTAAQASEDDESKPNLEQMIEERSEKMKAVCEADEANLETLKTKLVEEWKAVEVLELDTSKISAEFVHIKLLNMLKNHIKYRKDLIERAQAIPLKAKEVPVYENSYTYKQSKFGVNSPINLFTPRKTKEFAVLYRERVYFPADQEEQEQFLSEPSKYVLGVESIPLDIKLMPRVVVQGLAKSGKTEVCQRIAAITGAVHLQMEQVVESFVDRDSSFAAKVSEKLKGQGRELDDLLLVQLIQKRVEAADCASRGWVLEGFPQTRAQAILMARKSLLPSNVIILNIPVDEVYRRTAPLVREEFGCNRTILKRRLEYAAKNMPEMVYFFQKFYNNVTSIDAMKSKWFLEDVAVRAISDNLKARMIFARDYQHAGTKDERPCRIENLNMDRCFFKQSVSQYGYFCPVSWKTEKKFVLCTHLPELAVLYRNLFYYFASEKQRELFVRNPRKFTENVIFSSERNVPRRMMGHKAAEIADTEKALLSYCPVTLADEEKLVPGNPILVISYKGDKWAFCSEEKLQKFAMTPQRYSKTKLPDKIPPEDKPVYLHNLQKEENSVTFLEQALGSVVTKGLREIGEQRLKYPTLTVKETMLKLFAIFLKTENPANTEHMKQKYMEKMQTFLERCTVPEELSELAEEKREKTQKGKWPQFKESYYNTLGQQYDKILLDVEKEKADGFVGYMK